MTESDARLYMVSGQKAGAGGEVAACALPP